MYAYYLVGLNINKHERRRGHAHSQVSKTVLLSIYKIAVSVSS